MKLLDYLKENDLSDAAFAAILGGDLSESAVRKWKYGERVPRLRDLVRIEEATFGKVKPTDFLPEQEAGASARPFRGGEAPRLGDEAQGAGAEGADETVFVERVDAAEAGSDAVPVAPEMTEAAE